MAAGDVIVFDQFLVDRDEGVHNLESDTIKVGLVTDTVTPTATTTDPRWGTGGSTNLSTNQVTPGGNYADGGPTIANPTVTLSGGASVFDGDEVSVLQDPSNPSGADWGIIYNDTATGKNAIGFVELPTDTDLSAGDFSITWNGSGIFSTDQA